MSFFPRHQSTVLLFVEPNAQNFTKTFSQDFRYLHYVFKQIVHPQMKRSIGKHVNNQLSNSFLEGNTLTVCLSFDRYFYSFVIGTAKISLRYYIGKVFHL